MIANVASVGVASALNGIGGSDATNSQNKTHTGNFMSLVSNALQDVSSQQSSATAAEAGYAAGVPGATLSKALVASDKASVAWNATVAVRNEVVSAYQSIMNMQF